MWLVGYLYNNNGMGTWCWEAAHALAAAGEQVTLVCSPSVALPGPTDLRILRVAPPPRARSVAGKVIGELTQLSAHGPLVMREAVRELSAAGVPVTAILLNATEFFDPSLPCPQLVTAWARGVTLREYLARLGVQLRGVSRHSLRAFLGTLGWWRKDWYAFRRAGVVLAVSTPLQDELQSHGVRAELLHPCTHSASLPPLPRGAGQPVRLLSAAVSLDEPRKRIEWMLESLRKWHGTNCTLTLIGAPSARVRAVAGALDMPVEFTGALSRDAVVERMREHDVFLFASVLDDWGYVITEAMSQGMAVVAPNLSPFDEILGDTGALYGAHDASAFRAAVDRVLVDTEGARQRSWDRARRQFSRELFAARLFAVVAERFPRH